MPGARALAGDGGDEHDGLAVLHERGAAGLLGQATDLDGQGSTVKVDLDFVIHEADLPGGTPCDVGGEDASAEMTRLASCTLAAKPKRSIRPL